jgi:CubicO group peptidase (beta-lactamase class C family)
MKSILIIITTTLLTLTANNLRAQSKAIEVVDSLLTSKSNHELFTGAVLIADSNGVLLSKAYNYADREKKIKNTTDTRFYMSRAVYGFVGTAIIRLAQEGKLKFTDTLSQYFKGMPAGDKITLHHMLTHSSGLPHRDMLKREAQGIRTFTDYVPYFRGDTSYFKPGSTAEISSGNIVLLAAIVEKVTGMSFQAYFKKTFLIPLGMKNTVFAGADAAAFAPPQFAKPYAKSDYGLIHKALTMQKVDTDLLSMWTSTNDLYKFDSAVFFCKMLEEGFVKNMIKGYTTGPLVEGAFSYIWHKTHTWYYTPKGRSSTV